MSRSWDPVADWYVGWSGLEGSEHHRELAIPTVLELLGPVRGHRVLDVGCGPAALARQVAEAGGVYTGVDSSRRMLRFARQHHGRSGSFIHGDASRLSDLPGIEAGAFDAVVFLLSIQDIDPLEPALREAARALRPGGRLILLMTHPCFRVPRQSGWGWDAGRKLRFRRVDRYITPLKVPMKRHGPGGRGATRSYHRPLGRYVSALAESGLLVDALREIQETAIRSRPPKSKAERRADEEIPLFLGLRALKPGDPGHRDQDKKT